MTEQVALVTGASRGIGRAIAEELLADGWHVLALARDEDRLADLATLRPDHVTALVADVTDPGSMRAVLTQATRDTAAPDLVVANAGVLAAVGATWQVEPDLWWREFEVNVRGVHTTLAPVLPAMLARGSGRIVVVSSGMGRAPSPWSSAYGASKAAVTHLVGSLAGELAGTGVVAFAISPGMVATDMTAWPADLLAHRPELAAFGPEAYLPVAAACDLVRDLASGRFDALTGRFIHVREDREALLAEVQRDARA
jgi:NAD(P)-dependent dehydrogenase (short-subunit alcohol dehydrogenase family)